MIKINNLYVVSNFEKVTNDDCPSFSGIVAGECKGELWVDTIDKPTIALANSYAVGSFAFLGNIVNDNVYMELDNFIKKDIFYNLKQQGINYFEFTIENVELKPYILKMFKDKTIQKEKEYSFRKTEHNNKAYSLPDDFKMQRVDSDFWDKITNGDFKNETFLTKRILESWESFENFKKKSVAYCITYSDSIASVIVGTARFKNVIPIDIETEKKFRHKGLAYSLTIEFVKECIKNGLIAQWDCMESNLNSRKLTEKAGFKFYKENEVYWFDI